MNSCSFESGLFSGWGRGGELLELKNKVQGKEADIEQANAVFLFSLQCMS